MSLALSNIVIENAGGSVVLVTGNITPSGSYAAGGDTLSFGGNSVGIPTSKPPMFVQVEGESGFIFRFDKGTTFANGKLKVFGGGNTARRRAVITSAQLLALNATPRTIIPAPGAGFANVFEMALIQKPAGTAYGGIAAGEDLSVKYTDASGLEVAQCETTGFLDQAGDQIRLVQAFRAASGIASVTPVANAVMVLHLLVGEIDTGTSDLNIDVHYRVVATTGVTPGNLSGNEILAETYSAALTSDTIRFVAGFLRE